jgi:hypothetical protein
LAVLVACATSACHTDGDQSSGGPSGETTVSIVIPHIRLVNDKCHAKGDRKIYIKVSGLRSDKKYHLYVYPNAASEKNPRDAFKTMEGTTDTHGNGSYVFSCQRKEGYRQGSYVMLLTQDGIDSTDRAVFRVL